MSPLITLLEQQSAQLDKSEEDDYVINLQISSAD